MTETTNHLTPHEAALALITTAALDEAAGSVEHLEFAVAARPRLRARTSSLAYPRVGPSCT
ncbi:hypothetical protein HCJ76_43305 [Streptomyces sp. MC1]|uniref:hypothetical protein n=1 Tax=Streptomyces TaxID=1883 RepID=UPI0018C965B2|nr:hypothetical protein [Streptomyces sp. MC1]MBG7704728.1 hypothetical protein [Streptomyces sp. MC1]